jgi:hypothetical protein
MEPRLTQAEVLYTDREWHPATVLGWYRLDVAHEQLFTGCGSSGSYTCGWRVAKTRGSSTPS